MLTYLLRRLLLMIPTLLGITVVVFAVMAMSPGGITAQTLVGGANMKPQEKQALMAYYNKRYGLDQPAPLQYLRWLNNVSPIGFTQDEHGKYAGFSVSKGMDLGTSFMYGRPVSEILAERIPITLLLNVITIPLIYAIAIVVGVKAATERGKRFDVVSSVSMLALWSIPTMLAGVLLLGFFANVQYFQWFPTAGISSRAAQDMPFLPHLINGEWVPGYLLDRLWHLVLPVICLSYAGFAGLAKLTRTSVLENLSADYARTARAKGLAEKRCAVETRVPQQPAAADYRIRRAAAEPAGRFPDRGIHLQHQRHGATGGGGGERSRPRTGVVDHLDQRFPDPDWLPDCGFLLHAG